MSREDSYTLYDARNHGFNLLELYKLWHWNSCLPLAAQHDEVEQRVNSINNEVEERFMPLPVDADGEVINVGDEVYARYSNGDYFNGRVHSLEFEKEATYAYVRVDEDGDLDQFATSRLHHGSHIPTVRQILNEFALDAYYLGVDAARNNETCCTETVDRRREMVKTYANELAPLLSDEAETGFEVKEVSQ